LSDADSSSICIYTIWQAFRKEVFSVVRASSKKRHLRKSGKKGAVFNNDRPFLFKLSPILQGIKILSKYDQKKQAQRVTRYSLRLKKGGNDEKNEVSFTNEISFFQLLTVYNSKEHTNCLAKKYQIITYIYL